MATSPTVLAGGPSVSVAPAKFPVLPLLIAVGAGVLLVVAITGGVLYYLLRSGKLPVQHISATRAETVPPIATHALSLEPMIVNLADAGGVSYLKIGLTLRVVDDADKKSKEAKNAKDEGVTVAAIRDTVLDVLGRQTAETLLATNGKEQLRRALKNALAGHNNDVKVTDVYFTDFLVQR